MEVKLPVVEGIELQAVGIEATLCSESTPRVEISMAKVIVENRFLRSHQMHFLCFARFPTRYYYFK